MGAEGIRMIAHIMRSALLMAVLGIALMAPQLAYARGHDGLYFGGGVMTIPMFTMEDRLTTPGGNSDRINFTPGPGAFLMIGYDFPNTSWGIQMPVEWQYFRLNSQEWVNSIGTTVEAVWRLVQWSNGCEFHLLGGLGWTHFFEGQINNNTHANGMNIEVGPGFSWFFAREDTRASLTIEAPLRYIYFFGDHLSRSGTSVFSIPVRLGVTVGF